MTADITVNDFDIHDLEALQTLINHGSHALGERIIALEAELQEARDTITRLQNQEVTP